MNSLKTLFATALIASVSFAVTAQADQLMDTIHPESADLFDLSSSINANGQNEIVSLNDTQNEQVWSFEYEQYVNPADFITADYADINEYMKANPTAAGGSNNEVFKWDEVAGEYQL